MVLYTTGCPQCTCLKQILDSHGYKYSVCEDADLMIQKGFTAVPMLEVDGQVMSFKDAMKWINDGGVSNEN